MSLAREELPAFERVDCRRGHVIDVALLPFQAELFAHEGIDQAHESLQFVVFEPPALNEAAGNRGRHSEEMQNVVAKVSHQNRRVLRHVDDVTHGMRASADHVESLAVGDYFLRCPLGRGHERRIAKVGEQVHAESKLGDEFFLADRLFRGCEQDIGEQADRRYGSR